MWNENFKKIYSKIKIYSNKLRHKKFYFFLKSNTYFVSDCEKTHWVYFLDSIVYGAERVLSASSPDECAEYCELNDCYGYDWDTTGDTCWQHNVELVNLPFSYEGVEHYRRACQGQH